MRFKLGDQFKVGDTPADIRKVIGFLPGGLVLAERPGDHVHIQRFDLLAELLRFAPLEIRKSAKDTIYRRVPNHGGKLQLVTSKWEEARSSLAITGLFNVPVGRSGVVERKPDEKLVWYRRPKRRGLSPFVIRQRDELPVTHCITAVIRPIRKVFAWEALTIYNGEHIPIEIEDLLPLALRLQRILESEPIVEFWRTHAFAYFPGEENEVLEETRTLIDDEGAYFDSFLLPMRNSQLFEHLVRNYMSSLMPDRFGGVTLDVKIGCE